MTDEDFEELVSVVALKLMQRNREYWSGYLRGKHGVLGLQTITETRSAELGRRGTWWR